MRKRYATCALVAALLFTTALAGSSRGQDQGFQAAEPIRRNQEFEVTFHQAKLKDGQVSWVNNTDTVDAGPALTPEQIDKGFKVGDFVVIRIKAPVDCYVYGVNNSQWDGAALVENGEKLQAGVTKDFVYRLTNRQGRTGVGNENILFLIRTQQVPQEEVAKFLQPAAQPTSGSPQPPSTSTPQIKLGGTPAQQQQTAQTLQQEVKKPGKKGAIVKVGCQVASIFFPFIGPMCTVASGFAAAEPVRKDQLQPAQDTQNLVVQFSFPLAA